VKAHHTPVPRAKARWRRSPNETRVLVDDVCLATVGRTHLWGLVFRRRKAVEQGSLATNEPIAPLTRTLGEDEANGCAMLACGVESATSIHPPRKWWRRDTTVGAPNVDAHAPNRVGEEAFRFVRSTRRRVAPAREARKGPSQCSQEQGEAARRSSHRSVHGADAEVPGE